MAFTDLHEIEEMFGRLEGQTSELFFSDSLFYFSIVCPRESLSPAERQAVAARLRQRAWRAPSKEKEAHAEYQRWWRATNPEKAKAADARQRASRSKPGSSWRARKAKAQQAYAKRQRKLAKLACLPSGTSQD